MSFLGNVLWFICGGVITALLWLLVGLFMAITIIGLPWARACFVIAKFTLFPFGSAVVSRDELTGEEDLGTGALGMLGNIIWFVLAGWWLAIAHLASACALAVTIIGIPFAWQHVKLAAVSLAPVGKTVVSSEIAEAVRLRAAQRELGRMR